MIMNLAIASSIAIGTIASVLLPTASSMMMDYHPLECNANLASATCTPWSQSVTGYTNVTTGKVTIPCGACVELDVMGDIELNGLDVVGKFVFF